MIYLVKDTLRIQNISILYYSSRVLWAKIDFRSRMRDLVFIDLRNILVILSHCLFELFGMEADLDNPRDYADNADARKFDPRLRGPVDPVPPLIPRYPYPRIPRPPPPISLSFLFLPSPIPEHPIFNPLPHPPVPSHQPPPPFIPSHLPFSCALSNGL